MKERDELLLSLRTSIQKAKITKGISPEEAFQNITLRPIIKAQHNVLVWSFKRYIQKFGKVYNNYTNPQRIKFIQDALTKNIAYKNVVNGMIIGQFTSTERLQYESIAKDIDRRILGIVKQRILDSMEELLN